MAERLFPIMDGPAIPWRLLAPHERQAQDNHSQSLERLAERHGLGCDEAVAILEDRKWSRMDEPGSKHENAKARLMAIVNADVALRAEAAIDATFEDMARAVSKGSGSFTTEFLHAVLVQNVSLAIKGE